MIFYIIYQLEHIISLIKLEILNDFRIWEAFDDFFKNHIYGRIAG